MKSKNVVGRMLTQKEPAVSRFKKAELIPRLIALLAAAVIWLAVYAADHPAGASADASAEISGVSETV